MNEMRLGRRAFLSAGMSATAAARTGTGFDDRVLVVVELRGGADALSLVVPYRDERYYAARPTTAISPPGAAPGTSIALDDRFALHPRLAPLLPWWLGGEMSIAVATGAPNIDRHHATARRALGRAIEDGAFGASLERWPDELSDTGDARTPFDERLRRVARDVRRGVGGQLRVVPSLGWDTHVAQGDALRGRLTELVGELARGLEVFRRQLGDRWHRAAIVVVSEFGRSLEETPMRGTDDGHAGVCFLIGRGAGGRILGRFPGLDRDSLSGGRYLAPTTSISDVVATWLRREPTKAGPS